MIEELYDLDDMTVEELRDLERKVTNFARKIWRTIHIKTRG
jgi:hypothetical protein